MEWKATLGFHTNARGLWNSMIGVGVGQMAVACGGDIPPPGFPPPVPPRGFNCLNRSANYNDCLACCNVEYEGSYNAECRQACRAIRDVDSGGSGCAYCCSRVINKGTNCCFSGVLYSCTCPENVVNPYRDAPFLDQWMGCIAQQEQCIRPMFSCVGRPNQPRLPDSPVDNPMYLSPGMSSLNKAACLCAAAACVERINCTFDGPDGQDTMTCLVWRDIESARLKEWARSQGCACPCDR